MRRGDFNAAWQLSDRVLRARRSSSCDHLPRHCQWLWRGVPLNEKRVLIRCYHGLGDTIQFIRYAPLVKSIAGKVTVAAQAQLIPLLSTVKGIDRLLPLEGNDLGSKHDVEVEVMELPHVFRTTIDTIPSSVPYIRVEKAVPKTPRFAVGIVWAGGDWDQRRSIPAALLAPLAELADIELQIFQVGSALAELRSWRAIMPRWKDIVTEASLIRSLDLMISVDSMPAHLAGALGVPVWTLLHKEADWRWMEGRQDSPWYPTMRLFRQECAGAWQPVIATVACELAKLSAARLDRASCRAI